MANSHKEMAHVLGLQKNPFTSMIKNTGWFIEFSVPSIKKRYNLFKEASNPKLNFDLLPTSFSEDAIQKITHLPHGGYVGFSCRWPRHAFTLHAVKEGEHTHFIYVNRGRRHYELATGNDKDEPLTVMVFSVKNQYARSFGKSMLSSAMALDPRKGMSLFLEGHKKQFNEELSQQLQKKDQKTGNCSIANSNIAWHFQLASEEMKKNKNKSFAGAYKDTEPKYREMRIKDRVQAFKYLLNDRGCYASDNAFLYNYFQVIEKFVRKDLKVRNQQNPIEHIKTLLDGLDSKELSKLIEPLINDNLTLKVDEYIHARIQELKKNYPNTTEEEEKRFALYTRDGLQSAKIRIMMLALKKLSLEEQKQLIAKDISLIGYADPKLQLDLLELDYNKYALYANKEVKKICSKHPFNQMSPEKRKEYNLLSSEMREFVEERADKKQKEFLQKSKMIATERKTMDIGLLSHIAAQKEVLINNTLRALYSYLSRGDQENATKAFEKLCRTCCERRFYLGGDKYSIHNQSAQWLINRINADDDIGKDFRNLLEIPNNNEVNLVPLITQKVRHALSGKHTNIPHHFNSYKERWNQQLAPLAPPTQTSSHEVV